MIDISKENATRVEFITPNDGYHYFFAYYDMRATGDGINQRHLVHRVTFIDRMQTAEDECELGYIEDGKFVCFAKTTAWNFQQGAMLQYHPYLENTVYYNTVKDGNFVTVTHNFATGEKAYTDRATAAVSRDGSFGLSVNFGRIFAFRPGYGYAGFVDEGAEINAPDNDGVFITDMKSGKSKLLVSYRDMMEESGFCESDKILINHITPSPDSKRYLMLVRDLRTDGSGWDTSMVVGDLNGGIHTVVKRSYVSHYYWINENEILAHANCDGTRKALYIINATTGEYREVAKDYLGTGEPDIHCQISPDGEYVIGDGYPIDGYRSIVSIKIKTGESRVVVSAKTIIPKYDDVRCDLHARFVMNGRYISYDTTEHNRREVALFPTELIRF